MYLAQGHSVYLSETRDMLQGRPWLQVGFRTAEPCLVTALNYEIARDRDNGETVAKLTLTMLDGPLRGTSFPVEWPNIQRVRIPAITRNHPQSIAPLLRHV